MIRICIPDKRTEKSRTTAQEGKTLLCPRVDEIANLQMLTKYENSSRYSKLLNSNYISLRGASYSIPSPRTLMVVPDKDDDAGGRTSGAGGAEAIMDAEYLVTEFRLLNSPGDGGAFNGDSSRFLVLILEFRLDFFLVPFFDRLFFIGSGRSSIVGCEEECIGADTSSEAGAIDGSAL